jgi:hypothetical protein
MQIGPSRFQPRPPSRQPTNLALLKGQEITSLTDKERDEIDFEAKSIIRQTMDRVKTMENLEKGDHQGIQAYAQNEEVGVKGLDSWHGIW